MQSDKRLLLLTPETFAQRHLVKEELLNMSTFTSPTPPTVKTAAAYLAAARCIGEEERVASALARRTSEFGLYAESEYSATMMSRETLRDIIEDLDETDMTDSAGVGTSLNALVDSYQLAMGTWRAGVEGNKQHMISTQRLSHYCQVTTSRELQVAAEDLAPFSDIGGEECNSLHLSPYVAKEFIRTGPLQEPLLPVEGMPIVTMYTFIPETLSENLAKEAFRIAKASFDSQTYPRSLMRLIIAGKVGEATSDVSTGIFVRQATHANQISRTIQSSFSSIPRGATERTKIVVISSVGGRSAPTRVAAQWAAFKDAPEEAKACTLAEILVQPPGGGALIPKAGEGLGGGWDSTLMVREEYVDDELLQKMDVFVLEKAAPLYVHVPPSLDTGRRHHQEATPQHLERSYNLLLMPLVALAVAGLVTMALIWSSYRSSTERVDIVTTLQTPFI